MLCVVGGPLCLCCVMRAGMGGVVCIGCSTVFVLSDAGRNGGM